MNATLTPEVRAELVGKVQKFVRDEIPTSEITDGLSKHLQLTLGVSDFVGLTDSILSEAIATAAPPVSDPAKKDPLFIPAVTINNEPGRDITPTRDPEPPTISDAPALTFFESIALPLATGRGWKVAPCYPWDRKSSKGKELGKTVHGALVPEPLEMISNDPAKIHAWGLAEPNANVCVYAEQIEGGLLFLDKDGAISLRERYERETGKKFDQTLLVRSSVVNDGSDGTITRGHWYFLQTPRTLGLTGNVPESKTGGLFSLRVHNQYVCSIGSLHPKTGTAYEVIEDFPVAPISDDLLDWLLKQVSEEKTTPTTTSVVGERVLYQHGQIHPALIIQAPKMMNAGVFGQPLIDAMLQWARDNCAKPLDESEIIKQTKDCEVRYSEKIRQKSGGDILFTQNGSAPQASNLSIETQAVASLPEIDTSELASRPTFPEWALIGTSLYEGLVKPAIASSSKHAEFIVMPAIQIMLNFLSGRVQIGFGQRTNLNIFVGLVSPYGHFFKSSSCALALSYFNYCGLLAHASRDMKNADGKIIVTSAGSPEGFGLSMQKCNATHAILFNDELGKFVSKAGIESSSFSSDLLSWYESGSFGNSVTNNRNNFSFSSGSYTFSWLWATTDRGFNRHWPKLAGISSGLEDRMFFVVSPEKPKPMAPHFDPNTVEASIKTKVLIDKAIQKEKYEFEDSEGYARKVSGMDPRSMALVQKLALYFCVDTGSDVIDDEHIERALALVEYRNQAAKFLAPIEADNQQGRLQKEIVRELRQNRGKMRYRDLCLNLDFSRYGVDVWKRAYTTMIPESIICEFHETTTPGKRPTRMVGLVKFED
jgi:hypothetical protein